MDYTGCTHKSLRNFSVLLTYIILYPMIFIKTMNLSKSVTEYAYNYYTSVGFDKNMCSNIS